MGTLEDSFRKRQKRQNIQDIVLATVSIAGLMTVAAVAPNVIQSLKLFGIDPKKRQKEIISRSRNRLVEKGLLTYEGKHIRLTPKGERKIEELDRSGWKINKPKKWDGKWRILIFDIPENRRATRDKIRTTLIHIGFQMIQKSVWIYPYDCEDYVNLLKADFKIGKNLLYIIADSIEYDKNYRSAFDLLN